VSYELLISFVLVDGVYFKDRGDGLGGFLIGGTFVPIPAFIIIGVIIGCGFMELSPPNAVFKPLHSRMVCLAFLWIGQGSSMSLAKLASYARLGLGPTALTELSN
jgi:hypothetical protein